MIFVYRRLLSFLVQFSSLLFLTPWVMTLRISCDGGVLAPCYWHNLVKTCFIVIPFVYNIHELDLIALRSLICWKIYTKLIYRNHCIFQPVWHKHDSKLAPDLIIFKGNNKCASVDRRIEDPRALQQGMAGRLPYNPTSQYLLLVRVSYFQTSLRSIHGLDRDWLFHVCKSQAGA